MKKEQPMLFDSEVGYYEQTVSQEEASTAFRVHASLIYKLGESLIADDITALSELIKNAYDADASICTVIIDSSYIENIDGDMCEGMIEISDNGCGMDLDTIINGWLTISNSPKKRMKKENKTTEKFHRYPLGDKGLGRLSVQKLGRYMQMVTKTKTSKIEYTVTIPWGDFLKNTTIDQIPVQVEEKEVTDGKSYTKIVIKDLVDPQQWKQKEKVDTLSNSLSKIISPFRSQDDSFRVVTKINGTPVEIDRAAFEELLRTARAKYTFVYKDGKLDIREEYKSSFFYSRKLLDKIVKNELSLTNTMLDQFLEIYGSKLSQLKRCDHDGFVFEEERSQVFSDIVVSLEENGGEQRFDDPGEFKCEIYEYSLDKKFVEWIYQDVEYTSIIKRDEYRDFIERFHGIKVVRDDFLVQGYGDGDGGDWLGLSSSSKTTGKYFDLRNDSVIGCVYLTGLHNSSLKETTNREGFVEDGYYKNFKKIIDAAIRRLNNDRNNLNDYMSEYLVEICAHSDEGTERKRDFVTSIENVKEKIRETSDIISDSIERLDNAQRLLDSVKTMIEQAPFVPPESIQNLRDLDEDLAKVNVEFKELSSYGQPFSKEIDVLDFEFEKMNERLRDLFELAGLGLSVETFTHEFDTSIHNIKNRNQKIIDNRQTVTIDNLIQHLQYVNYALDALRKQMSYFNPGLKFVRAERQIFSIREFLEEHKAFYKERCCRNNIKFILSINEDFKVRINKGMLNQVFDNLFNNSEYWLNFSYKYGYVKEKEYHIEIRDKGYILIWDNGIGISHDIEDRLFEPFESKKENGRGLGLYVVASNLQYNSSSIKLLSERNAQGNLYKFELNLLEITQ